MKIIALVLFSITAVYASPGQDEAPYSGSSFNEVRKVVFEEDATLPAQNEVEQEELDNYHLVQLPHYTVSWRNFKRWVGHKLVDFLKRDAKRTIADNHDYYRRLEKLVHSNGICFTGEWTISESSDYTGYFSKGKKALFIGRGSVSSDNTLIGHKRTMGFAGKLFPTMDPSAVVKTANFVTIDNLSGTANSHFLDVALTNEPALGFAFTPLLSLRLFFAFSAADRNIGFRPVDPIAALGLAASAVIHTPQWMMLKPRTTVVKNEERDFRDELRMVNFPGGLEFDIYASNQTKDPEKLAQWLRLGFVHLNESIISYGCDRRLHFHHNKMADPRRGD